MMVRDRDYGRLMHHVMVILKILIVAKLLILTTVAIVLLKPFLANRRCLICRS
jgi:hypothetical protein